jgi:hypothetical protein
MEAIITTSILAFETPYFSEPVPFNAIVAMVRKSISRAMFSDMPNVA